MGAAAAMAGGFLVAMALPPWGFWPLAPIGIAILALLLDVPARQRALRGAAFGASLFAIGCFWMFQLTAPGYAVVILLYSSMAAIACAASRRGPWQAGSLIAAYTVMEAVRFSWPFGGVPVASLPITQAAGPFAPVARIGGPMLLTAFTMLCGITLAAAAKRRKVAAIGAIGAVALTALGYIAPHGVVDGHATVAYVQGGGKQGTRAATDDPTLVFQRHLDATRTLNGPVDLVIWPENVIAVPSFSTSIERTKIAEQSARIGAPFAVGVTQDSDVSEDRFVNAQVVVQADGTLLSQYEKVRRVPFGEFMPMRGFLHAIGAPTDVVPRDAIAGTGPAVIEVPKIGKVGVAISWEVFFGGRGRDAAANGGRFLTNPTNGASYVGTLLQTQQVASSRLRAIESGRWLVQVSPTGFSAFVSPDGDVYDRSAQVEAKVVTRTIDLRHGFTPYRTIGDKPWVGLAAVALFICGRRRRSGSVDVEDDGDRAVVGEGDLHIGPEAARLDGSATTT
jgi:apolipoprotein N-acyltransferase